MSFGQVSRGGCQKWKRSHYASRRIRLARIRRLSDGLMSRSAAFANHYKPKGQQSRIQKQWLTPNAGLLRVKGSKSLTIDKLEKQRTNLKTIHGLDIIRITAELGSILIAFRRPSRKILHLSDAWLRRALTPTSPESNLAFLLGEKEDDGEILYMPIAGSFHGQPQVAPHTLIAGSTGSGKGILATNLILDLCAFNSPASCKFYLIDPKQGADYMWAEGLPHLQDQIIVDMNAATQVFGSLVAEMEERYRRITAKKCRNMVEYNRLAGAWERLPRLFIFHDEISDWMLDEHYRDNVTTTAARLGNMGRAAGNPSNSHGAAPRRNGYEYAAPKCTGKPAGPSAR